MQIVIDISKALYNRILDKCYTDADLNHICGAVTYGTPLPKGHGKIVDANRVLENGDNWEVETALMQTEAIIEADTTYNPCDTNPFGDDRFGG